ncbi:UMP kinase [Methanoplanus endosymbiosus]|uniref:Uridylate kinase n=1 Tax=Methanoplanus endosymbiosus TaxID=33865 RepID=A0A9E7PKQ6_9EURY|nr:UMP kinase [Methanoplanus endosymbiosus]UUX91939.1 UMP kinase [Methanoplanus endosymbiosus]
MKTIVLSVGGSIIVPSLESNKISEFASVLKSLSEKFKVFVVIGGGGEARRYISVARSLAIDEATCDEVGIMVTRINASLLSWALGDDASPAVAENYNDALLYSKTSRIVIMGGITPGQTTDAVSAVLAERSGADLLVNVTSIDGIYSDDPKKNSEAVKFDSLTHDELVDIVSSGKMKAGSNNIIDLVAAKIVQRSEIPLLVIDGRDPAAFKSAILNGERTGTIVSSDRKMPKLL